MTQDMPDARSFEERVFARFDSLDARFGRVESRLENVETRLESVETRLGALEAKQFDTKPIWERALKEIIDLRDDMTAAVDGEVRDVESGVLSSGNVIEARGVEGAARHNAGHGRGVPQRIASDVRQRLNRPLADGRVEVGGVGLQRGAFRRDGDDARHFADGEGGVHAHLLVNAEVDAGLLERTEAGGLNFHLIHAGRQQRYGKFPSPARGRSGSDVGAGVGDGDLRAGHGGAVRVGDIAEDRARDDLRGDSGAKCDED